MAPHPAPQPATQPAPHPATQPATQPAFAAGPLAGIRRLVGVLCAAAALALTTACGSDSNDARGEAVELTDVATLAKSTIDQATAASGLQPLSGPARCDVSIRQLVYLTVGPRGERDIPASAAVLVPGGADCSGPFPLVAYAKATDLIRARTLANASDSETALLVGMLAAQGYAVVATDYIGFARSDYPYHPFLDAASEADSILDAIRATRAALPARGVALEDGVLLTGYSQGGHASMATQRALEAGLGIVIAAAGHSSGPYDLSGTTLGSLARLPAGSGGSSVFFPYAVTGYQKTYGNVYATPAEYFRPPYDAGIEGLLPGTSTAAELITSGRLPAALGDLITDRMIADLQDPRTGLRQALERNSLLGWTPRAPTLLCGGARDPVVDFGNAQRAQAAFQASGAAVGVVDVEQVPAFASLFPATLTGAQLSAYHGTTVPPLCLKIVRDQLFEAVRRQ